MPKTEKKKLAQRIAGEAKGPRQLLNTVAEIIDATEAHTPPFPGDRSGGQWPLPRGPPSLVQIIRHHELSRYVGLKRTVIAEMIAKGEFPKPVKLNDAGRILGWIETEIVAWQQARIAIRDAGASPEPDYRPVPPRSPGRPHKIEAAALAGNDHPANKRRRSPAKAR